VTRPSHEDGKDVSEFQKAMEGVKPLAHPADVQRPKTVRRRRRVQPSGAESAPGFEVERSGEHAEGLAPGIDRGILRQLRNGQIRWDEKLDLHGLRAEDARRRVRDVLQRARDPEHRRCVLVVHGRGRHSEAEPVIKEALLDWLAEPPLADFVMAFSSATGRDGGVGATYVLLRRIR
jgi:DNA-nicking Smr family endonuclease